MWVGLDDVILTASPGRFWSVLGWLGMLTLWMFYLGFRQLHYARLIEDTPTARIRSAAQGYVELEGQVVALPGEPIHAPLSGRLCVWYEYRIDHRGTRFQSGRRQRWVSLERGTSEAIFGLDDDTSRCVVDPEGAQIHPAHVLTWYGHERYPVHTPPGHSDFLGPYRYTERLIEPGDPLYALGWFETLKDAAGQGLMEETRALLRRWKSDQQTLLHRFDLDRDGRIDAKEWEIIRKQATREALRARLRQPPGENIHLLRKPPRRDYPFILAAVRQPDLVARYRFRAGSALIVFLLGCVAIAWAVGLRL